MSYVVLYNNEVNPNFNINDWKAPVKFNSILADLVKSNSVVSGNVSSSTLTKTNNDGNEENMATELYVDGKIIGLKNELLGGASSAYDTLKELQTELEQDDTQISNILTSLGNKASQESVNNLSFAQTILRDEFDAKVASDTTQFSTINSSLSSLSSTVNSVNNKTSALSMSGDVLTINSKLALTAGITAGYISLGDTASDTINFVGQTITGLNKNHVGLSQVNNTSDANKPISTATQNALNTINSSITSLNNKTSALSMVDDVLTINSKLALTAGSTGGYVALGDTASDTINFIGQTINGLNKSHVGLSNVDNTSDANKPISNATQSSLTALDTRVTTNEGNISNLQTKTNALSVSGDVLTINSKLALTAGSTAGYVSLGDTASDTINFIGQTINGLNKSHVGLSAVNNTADLSKPISTATQTALNLKADKSQIVTTSKWVVNNGVNTLSSVLSSIGSSTSQVIEFSAGTHSDTTNPNNLTALNLVMIGQDSGFSSPVSILNYGLTISGATNTRARLTNLGINGNVIIDGTEGRHTFKSVTFSGNVSFLNTTTNFINFHYCSFSGQVNIPSTFGGLIVFYFCDFSGATLNFNNISNQQIYINSCVNLPSLSLNALLNGFNMTASSSAINTVSLNCSGSVALQNNSISQASVNGLTTALDTKLNVTDASNTYATISNLNTTNTNVTNLQQKTNVLTYDSGTDTLSINSKLSVAKDSNTNNATINLGDGLGTDVINVKSNIVANNQTITPTQLGYVSGASSNIQTQITARALDNAVVKLTGDQTIAGNKTFTGTIAGISKTMVGLSNVDNTSDLNKPISNAVQGALDLKANITYVDNSIANLVNSAPTTLDTLNELATALGNDPNFATTISTQIGTKANDNAVVKLSGDQSITGNKDFATISLGGTNLNTRLTSIETTNSNQDTSISTLNTNVSNLQSKTNAISYNAGTDTMTINSKLSLTAGATGAIFLGDTGNGDIIYLQGNLNVLGTTNITPTEISRLSGVSSGIQSQLNSRVTTNTTQTISGQKNFTGGLQLNGTDLNTRITNIETTNTNQDTSITNLTNNKQDNLTFDTAPTENSTNIVRSGGIFTALQNYQTTSGMSAYLTVSNATLTYQPLSSMSNYLTTASASSTYQTQSGMSSYLTTSSASSTYLTQSSASSTYQTQSGMSSYPTLSGNNTLTGTNTFNNYQVVERMCEQITQAGSGTSLSLSYTSIKGIVVYSPSANYALTLTNVPTSNTNCIYTLTFRYNTKFYANTISVNGSSITMTAIGGLSNISVNASATFVYQTIHLIFNNSSVPTVTTSVASIW